MGIIKINWIGYVFGEFLYFEVSVQNLFSCNCGMFVNLEMVCILKGKKLIIVVYNDKNYNVCIIFKFVDML